MRLVRGEAPYERLCKSRTFTRFGGPKRSGSVPNAGTLPLIVVSRHDAWARSTTLSWLAADAPAIHPHRERDEDGQDAQTPGERLQASGADGLAEQQRAHGVHED
jgi:hypothetical protein